MAPRYTIDELCELYQNEQVHTEYVTRLALNLFDATRSWTRLTPWDRQLLEAAARLHDIGYAVDPRNHLRGSLRIIREHGLEGYQDRQLPYILAAIALHQKSFRQVINSPTIRDLAHPLRGLRLGALLRIADGLDQSHIQDSRLGPIRKEGTTIVVPVQCSLSPANLTRADEKAVLWREVFPLDIQFERVRPPPGVTPSVLGGEEEIYEAARRLCYRQYKIIRQNEAGAKAGVDPEPLHDLRVAIRRFRVYLRVFRQPLRDTWAADIDRRLRVVTDALGPARDSDVWTERMRTLEQTHNLDRSRVWQRYTTYHAGLVEEHRDQVRQALDSGRYRNLMQEIAFFLRIQCPDQRRHNNATGIRPYAAKQLMRWSKRVYRAPIPGGEWHQEDVHELRKMCRRTRYIAEAFAPLFGPATRRWAKKCKFIADLLGHLHDADVGLERVPYEAVAPHRLLVERLCAQQTEALAQLDSAWANLKNQKHFRRLQKELGATLHRKDP